MLLLGFAAGAPLLPKLAEAGRADVASATALMVLLMAASVVVMPLALPLFVKGVAGESLADRGAAGGADARPTGARHGSAAVLRHASAPDCCRC